MYTVYYQGGFLYEPELACASKLLRVMK